MRQPVYRLTQLGQNVAHATGVYTDQFAKLVRHISRDEWKVIRCLKKNDNGTRQDFQQLCGLEPYQATEVILSLTHKKIISAM